MLQVLHNKNIILKQNIRYTYHPTIA